MNQKAWLLASGTICCALAWGQAPPAVVAHAFEVVSIRLSDAVPDHAGVTTDKGRFSAENVTLKDLIRMSYGVPEAQIVGGPKWLGADRYDIKARADTPAGDEELMIMVRSMLVDRFRLTFHREAKTMQGYALVRAPGGLKAKPSAPDARSSTNTNSSPRGATMKCEAISMPDLSKRLAELVRAPVVDETSATGQFDFVLEWVPDDLPAENPSGLSIFTALQQQLGLKLESRKLQGELFVIDRAEAPSAN